MGGGGSGGGGDGIELLWWVSGMRWNPEQSGRTIYEPSEEEEEEVQEE